MATVDPSKYLSNIATQNNSQPQSNSVNAADVFLNTVRNGQQRASNSPSNYLSNNVVSPENYLNSSATSSPLQFNLRVTQDKWDSTLGAYDAYKNNRNSPDFVYDENVNRNQYKSVKSLMDDIDADIEMYRQRGNGIKVDNTLRDKEYVQGILDALDEEYDANKAPEVPANQGIDNSIQKTLGATSDYNREIANLERQISALESTNHRGVIRQDEDAVSGEKYDVYGNVNDEALHQLREQLQNANANKAAAKRAELRETYKSNADYAQNSTAATPLAENLEAQRLIGGRNTDDVSGQEYTEQSAIDLLGYASEDENQMFNYILNTQGEDAAKEYIDDLRYDLNARQASARSIEASQYADENGLKASAKSVGQNLISGVGLLDTAIQKASAKKNNRRIDYNTWANQQTQQVQATRQTVAQDLTEKNPNIKFNFLGREVNAGDLYQLGMSMADSGATALLGAATGGGGWTAGLLGASAGSQTAQEAVRNGASDSEALQLGFAAMLAETATEKFSIDGLLTGTGKGFITNLLKQAGVEASEEAASTILNNIADEAIRGENSDYNRRIRELEQNGMSHEEASNQAWKEFGQQIMFDAVGGAISGGIMGGMFRGVRSNTNTQTQTEQAQTEEQNSMLNNLSDYDQREMDRIRLNSNNALSRTLTDYDNQQLNELRGIQDANARAEIDRQNEAIRAENENIRNQNAQIQEAQAEQRYANEVWDEASERAANASSITQFKKKNLDWLKANGYSSADATNLFNSIHKDIDAHKLTEQEELALTYGSKAQFRADLVAQSDGKISFAEAGEIYDSARNKNRWNEEQQAARERTRAANENPLVNAALQEEKAELSYPEQRSSVNPLTRTLQNASQNSPLEPTRAVETNNVSTGATPLATNGSQTSSAPMVSENARITQRTNRTSSLPLTRATKGIGTQLTAENADAYNRGIEVSGTLDSSTASANDIAVPAAVNGRNIEQSAKTIIDNTDAPISEAMQNIVGSGMAANYVTVRNTNLAEKAKAKIEKAGISNSLSQWMQDTAKGRVNEDIVAEGAVLINNAIKEGAGVTPQQYVDLLVRYTDIAHNAAEALQAQRILQSLSPEGKLLVQVRTVENLNKKLSDRRGKKHTDIKIDPQLVDEYRNAQTDEARDVALDNIQQNIADQVPSTFMDKFTALRYLNMLGNLKTQGRNLAGNFLMKNAAKAKRTVQAVATDLANAFGANIEKQTSAKVNKDLKNQCKELAKTMKDEIITEGKYQDQRSQTDKSIQDKVTVFKQNTNWGKNSNSGIVRTARGAVDALDWMLEHYRDATNFAMEESDKASAASTFADAMAGYLQAHGVTDLNNASQELKDNATAYAMKEAREATFHDDNAFSKAVSSFDKNFGETGKAIAQGIMPFRKTPANVAVRAVEYSPVGMAVKGIQAISNKMRTGSTNITSTELINSVSKSLTGTAALALGALLRNLGVLKGKEEDEDLDNFQKMRGDADYSLSLGGKEARFTIDWAAPMSIPLFMGVAIADALDEADGNWSIDAITGMLNMISAPLLEQSMLSGVNDAIDNLSGFGSGDQAAITKLVTNAAIGFLTQGMTNQLLGQLESAFQDRTRQTTYIEKGRQWQTENSQYNLGKVFNKIPGKDYQQVDYIDAWGRKQDNGGFGRRALQQLISPGYLYTDTSTEIDGEIERLYKYAEDNGLDNILPDKTSVKDEIDGTQLSPEEYETYATERGQRYLNLATEFLNSDYGSEMSDEDKVTVLSSLKDYAEQMAKDTIREGRGTTGKNDWADEAEHFGDDTNALTKYIVARESFRDAIANENYSGVDALLKTLDTHTDDGSVSGDFTNEDTQYYVDSISGLEKYVRAARGGVTADMLAEAQDVYSDYNKRDDLSKEQMTTRFTDWVDDGKATRDWTSSQKSAVKELFKYWNMSPVNTERYEKMGNYGVNADNIASIESRLETLGQSEGFKDLTSSQQTYKKYDVILDEAAGLDDDQALALVKSYGSLGPGGGKLKYMVQKYFGDRDESFQESLYNAVRDERDWSHNWSGTKPVNPYE